LNFNSIEFQLEQVPFHFTFNCTNTYWNVWCISNWLFHQLAYGIIFINGQKSWAVY